MERYEIKGQKRMRCGYTTGTCSAAAAKAAAFMLFTGNVIRNVSVLLPGGESACFEVEKIERGRDFVSCGIVKDAGDDPDVTNGLTICALVRKIKTFPEEEPGGIKPFSEEEPGGIKPFPEEEPGGIKPFPEEEPDGIKSLPEEEPDGIKLSSDGQNFNLQDDIDENRILNHDGKRSGRIFIDGGQGVGRVTKPGLDQSVGSAAINSTPRRMIEKSVREAMEETGEVCDLSVTIFIPGGEEAARSTLNSTLGIIGGLSILGTSGIVRPMSEQAMIDTIRVEVRQKMSLCHKPRKILLMAPGNYGLDYLKEEYGINSENIVRMSNYIGESMDIAVNEGADAVIVVSHIGKIVKVASGIMNTHSHQADARLETMTAYAIAAGAHSSTGRDIMKAVTTDGAIEILRRDGILKETMELITDRILYHLRKRAGKDVQVAAAVFSNVYGLLGKSSNFDELMTEFCQNNLPEKS